MTGLSPYYAFMQTEETIFQYSGRERFIRIIETSPRQQEIERCLILDETLSVIEKDKGRVIDYKADGG